MKLHIGPTREAPSTARPRRMRESDIKQLPDLLHGEEKVLFGDHAYWSELHRDCAKEAGVRYRVKHRAKPGKNLREYDG